MTPTETPAETEGNMTSTGTYVVATYRPGIFEVGGTGVICKTDDNSYIIKYPKDCSGDSTYNEFYLELMILERQIYERLGPHEGIIPYHGPYNDEGAIKLTYAKQGNLEDYICAHNNMLPPQSFRATWIRSLINTFYHTYTRKTLHQDIKLNNIFVHHDSVKLADFANGAIFPLDADMATICAQDPLSRVDLLGIGCVLYSIATWTEYNFDYYEHENRFPKPDEIPTTNGVMYREIIDKCWRDEYNNIEELYDDFQWLDSAEQSISKGYAFPRMDFILWFCMVPSLMLFSGRYLCEVMEN